MLNVSKRFRRCIFKKLIRREGSGVQDDSEDLQHGNGGGFLFCFVSLNRKRNPVYGIPEP